MRQWPYRRTRRSHTSRNADNPEGAATATAREFAVAFPPKHDSDPGCRASKKGAIAVNVGRGVIALGLTPPLLKRSEASRRVGRTARRVRLSGQVSTSRANRLEIVLLRPHVVARDPGFRVGRGARSSRRWVDQPRRPHPRVVASGGVNRTGIFETPHRPALPSDRRAKLRTSHPHTPSQRDAALQGFFAAVAALQRAEDRAAPPLFRWRLEGRRPRPYASPYGDLPPLRPGQPGGRALLFCVWSAARGRRFPTRGAKGGHGALRRPRWVHA